MELAANFKRKEIRHQVPSWPIRSAYMILKVATFDKQQLPGIVSFENSGLQLQRVRSLTSNEWKVCFTIYITPLLMLRHVSRSYR